MSTALGRLLASWRDESGLSLRDCARRAGFSYQHVRRLERGEQVPSIEVLWKLSQILELGFAQVAELAAEAHADSAERVTALSASKIVLTSGIGGGPGRATTKLGEFIWKSRSRYNASLGLCAQLSGCSKSYLARLEQGNAANPNIEVLVKLSKLFDVSVGKIAEIASDPLVTGRGWAKARKGAGEALMRHRRKMSLRSG